MINLFPVLIHLLVTDSSCGPNVSIRYNSRGRVFVSSKISLYLPKKSSTDRCKEVLLWFINVITCCYVRVHMIMTSLVT